MTVLRSFGPDRITPTEESSTYELFHKAMASRVHGQLRTAANHIIWYRSLKEFDWIEQGDRPWSHDAMVSWIFLLLAEI